MDDAAYIDVREQPFDGGHPARHPTPEPRHSHREIIAWRSGSRQRDPVRPFRSAIDVVGIAGKIGDDPLDRTSFGAVEPISADAAAPSLGEQKRFVIVSEAHAVGEKKVAEYRPRDARRGIVADDPTVAAAF